MEYIQDIEARIDHAMDFLCDIIPHDTPNYLEELRAAAEDYIAWEDAGCPAEPSETFYTGTPSQDHNLPF